jgi:hypothetical protein
MGKIDTKVEGKLEFELGVSAEGNTFSERGGADCVFDLVIKSSVTD